MVNAAHSHRSRPSAIINTLTSKPIEPTPSTLKADLVALVNSNLLITKIIGKSAQELCVSSMSASKFEFLELPIGTGSTLNSRGFIKGFLYNRDFQKFPKFDLSLVLLFLLILYTYKSVWIFAGFSGNQGLKIFTKKFFMLNICI